MAALASAVVKGGFWEVNGVPTMVSISGASNARREMQQNFGGLGGFALIADRVLWRSLVGAAPGGLVTVNKTQIQPNVELGGLRTVETVSLLNRNSVAGDVTEFQNEWLSRMSGRTGFGPNPPPNLDRNPLGTR